MVADGYRYRYVGPPDIAAAVRQTGSAGQCVRSVEDLRSWLAGAEPRDQTEPFTYVVDPHGILRLAPRRSEHVACAGGGEVLAAGEITFVKHPAGLRVAEISNQSTGYCPDPSCWAAVAAALDHIGIERPDSFTAKFVFRRCPDCYCLNIVKGDDYACALCDQSLPDSWNVDPRWTAAVPYQKERL